MSQFVSGDLAWIPATSTQARYTIPSDLKYGSNRAAWLPVVVKRLEGNDQLVGSLEWDSHVEIKCKSNLVYPREAEDSSLDLSKLKYHNDGAIIHALGKFYADLNFSAKVAKYFLCMNPGHRLVDEAGHHHNAAADMLPYFNGDPEAPLSVYTAADAAYRKVSEGLLNQTVVLRGCSGAGKTEASKHILQYLLFAESPSKLNKSSNYPSYTPLGHAHNPLIDLAHSPVSRAVAAGVAVMDVFGGAPCGRNPTSSRVIRQTKLVYDLDGKLSGVDFQYHMFDMSCLDMTRIDKVAPYRIFSLLALGIPQSDPRSADFKVTSSIADDLKALSSSHEADALADFAHLEGLLRDVQLPADTWTDIQHTLAAVLHLLRLNVSGSEAATISAATKNHVAHAEELLRLEKGTLGPALLKKSMDIGGEQTFKNMTQEDSKISILALGAILYEKTFKFLLRHCSAHAASAGGGGMEGPSLRIIDCCGNESLDDTPNQLTQFLNNVAEEKINEHYMFRAFEREEQLFRAEGVTPPAVGERADLGPLAALLDEPPLSIINILEEVTLMQRGSDKALFDKIFSTHSKGKLIKIAGRTAPQTSFIIKHSFGDVQYDLDGFIAANKTAPSADVKKLIKNSLQLNFPFLQEEVEGDDDEEKKEEVAEKPPPGRRMTGRASPAASKAIKMRLVANQGREELNKLLKSVIGSEKEGEADPIYVFCLKANSDLQGVHFDPAFIAPQIKFFNLSELSHFCGQGFAKFELFKEFYDRYRLLFPMHFVGLPWKLPADSDHKSLVRVLLQECAALACEPSLLTSQHLAPVLGNTKIFLRDSFVDILEHLRSSTLVKYSRAATMLQASARARFVRRQVAIYKKGFLQLQALTRKFVQRQIYTRKIRSAKKIQGYFLMKKHSSHYKDMLSAVEVLKRRLLSKMIQRIRYKRLQRATRSLQQLSRGFVLRQHVNHMLRAALVLQTFAADFIRRLRRFYFRKVAVVRIQQVYRGARCRHEHRAAVRVLKKRRDQRIGTRAVVRIQAHWRTTLQRRRVEKITAAAKCIQGWSISRKKRNEFLHVLFLTKWLQCTARRVIATNIVNALHSQRMLEIEAELLENVRGEELQPLDYHSAAKLADLRIGAGFTKNVTDKFVRYIIGYDVSFDFSSAYPEGWVQTVLDFRKQLTDTGKRRIAHIAVGDSHTVLVDSSSNMFSFGLGDYGQLGRADRKNSAVPKQVDPLKNTTPSGQTAFMSVSRSVQENVEVRSVTAGRDHTLALTSRGYVFSWGGNRRGQLGHSSFNSSAIPRLVEGVKNAKCVVSGSYHSCCLADPGVVYTWGARECLGRGADGDECSAKSLPFFSKRRVQMLAAGDSHVVCRSGRSFYSWGSNAFGQLGIGGAKAGGAGGSSGDEDEDENSDANVRKRSKRGKEADKGGGGGGGGGGGRKGGDDGPAALGKILPSLVNISSGSWSEKDFFACQLVAGGRHVLLALHDRLWAWGWNVFGQVGNGTTTNVHSPLLIRWEEGEEGGQSGGSVSGGTARLSSHIAQVTAGWRNSVIITAGGDIYAWGHAGLHGSSICVPDSSAAPVPVNVSAAASTSTSTSTPAAPALAPKEPVATTAPATLPATLPATSAATVEPAASSTKSKPILQALDPGDPLLSPRKIFLPARLRDQQVVNLYSTHSSAMSLCAIDVLVAEPPKEPLVKTKYVSRREAKPLLADTTTSEFTRLQREQLGSWSSSSKMKGQREAIKASLAPKATADDDADLFNTSAEWGSLMRLSSRGGKVGAASGKASAQQRQAEQERRLLVEKREKREGRVTHEGLLGLFSPVNTRPAQQARPQDDARPEQQFDLFGDEASETSSQDDSTAVSQGKDRMVIPAFERGSSSLLLPSAGKNNLSLTKLAQQRRSSIAAGRQTAPFLASSGGGGGTWHATDKGATAPRRRASRLMAATLEDAPAGQKRELEGGTRGRRSSLSSMSPVSLLPARSGSLEAPPAPALDPRQGRHLARSNKESHELNSKFNRDLASLGDDIYRKREVKKNRFKPTSSSTDSASGMSSSRLGGKVSRQDSGGAGAGAGGGGLSLVAVSDLATMIQSIKEESMQHMSASWKF